ncbi:MAG: hypothetical protein ABIO35_08355 [Nitrobacter sp.]
MAWTKKQDDAALELAGLGYSRSVIGRILGFTKNAVIGRLSRLKKSIVNPVEEPKPVEAPPPTPTFRGFAQSMRGRLFHIVDMKNDDAYCNRWTALDMDTFSTERPSDRDICSLCLRRLPYLMARAAAPRPRTDPESL